MSVLPDIAQENVFALKGGTAINLFHRDMPRLSVDIDLTYLPTGGYEEALKGMDEALERIQASIMVRNPGIRAERISRADGHATRIMVYASKASTKIETSPLIRGAVHSASVMPVADAVVDPFGFAEMKILDFNDLYGGKIHAALDRQHPRDLFDVKLLYENEGLGDVLFRTFMVYVASSPRPMHELLSPMASFDETLYSDDFVGITRETTTKEELIEVRARLHADIRKRLTGGIAGFLLSLHDAEPDFDLIDLPKAVSLPAVRWKIKNLERLKRNNSEKHAEQRKALEYLLCKPEP